MTKCDDSLIGKQLDIIERGLRSSDDEVKENAIAAVSFIRQHTVTGADVVERAKEVYASKYSCPTERVGKCQTCSAIANVGRLHCRSCWEKELESITGAMGTLPSGNNPTENSGNEQNVTEREDASAGKGGSIGSPARYTDGTISRDYDDQAEPARSEMLLKMHPALLEDVIRGALESIGRGNCENPITCANQIMVVLRSIPAPMPVMSGVCYGCGSSEMVVQCSDCLKSVCRDCGETEGESCCWQIDAVTDLIFEKIEHGDAEHRMWLKDNLRPAVIEALKGAKYVA